MLMQGRQVIKKDLTGFANPNECESPEIRGLSDCRCRATMGKTLGFNGNYCLTMQSSLGSWQSLQTTLDVE